MDDYFAGGAFATRQQTGSGGGGGGDVSGPGSSTDMALVRWDGATGELLQNSGVILSDANHLLFGGANGTAIVDIAQATDSVFGVRVEGDATDAVAFSTFVFADAASRFNVLATGSLNWGDGAGATDVSLSRSAAGTLSQGGQSFVLDSPNTATSVIDRGAITNFGLQVFRTAGTDEWIIGQLNNSTNNFYIQDAVNGFSIITAVQGATPAITAAGSWVFNPKITVGVAGTATGSIDLKGTTSGTVTLKTADAAGTWTLTLPTDDGNSGQLLSTNGSGVTSWVTNGAGDVVGPASSFDDALATFDGTTGKLLQNTPIIVQVTGMLGPLDNDGGTLGDVSHQWSDLFFFAGGVINWDNNDLTLTHSSNLLTLAGGVLALPASGLSINSNVVNIAGAFSTAGANALILTTTGSTNVTLPTTGTLLAGTYGTYTPTLTGVTNVAASTAYVCQYCRVGNVVTVGGKFDLDPTASAATELGISLPIASNFTNEQEAGGSGASDAAVRGGLIVADVTNDRVSFRSFPNITTNQTYGFTFTYTVI